MFILFFVCVEENNHSSPNHHEIQAVYELRDSFSLALKVPFSEKLWYLFNCYMSTHEMNLEMTFIYFFSGEIWNVLRQRSIRSEDNLVMKLLNFYISKAIFFFSWKFEAVGS